MSLRPQGYFAGRTPSFACQADPRFSYCLHVPREPHARPARLLVAVHDTLRNNQTLRDQFSDYAERTNTVVLAPLFAAGLGAPDDLDDYKYLRAGDIRYDELLLAMAAEVSARYGLDASRFALFGFSGGAHFAHRMLYVHPQRLRVVVAGAPGSVTLPTEDHAWWPGLRDFPSIFGAPVDWASVRAVPTLLVVGADDIDPRGIVNSADHPNWVDGANAAGTQRVERLRTLHAQLAARGCQVTHEALPGVGHVAEPIVEAAIRFLEAHG
jgi:poly(3-hydroxybutyrate) depolymerase